MRLNFFFARVADAHTPRDECTSHAPSPPLPTPADVEECVMVCVKRIAEMGAYVQVRLKLSRGARRTPSRDSVTCLTRFPLTPLSSRSY